MEPNTSTYREMYEGEMIVYPPNYPQQDAYEDNSNTFYHNEIGFCITATHKLAQDKPTVVISIPHTILGIDIPDKETENAVADFFLREFGRYIDELNVELYNRSRPDTENGKFILCKPGGEIITRNTAYFALCPQKDYENGGGKRVYLLNDGISRPPLMCLCIRMQVQLPRKKLRKAIQMLCRSLPDAVDQLIGQTDTEKLEKAIELARKQLSIREWLKNSGYCAFILRDHALYVLGADER